MIQVAIHLDGEHGFRDEWLPAVPRIGEHLWYDHLWDEQQCIVWVVTEVRWYPGDSARDGIVEIMADKKIA